MSDDLVAFLRAIGAGEQALVGRLLGDGPELVVARLGRGEEVFLAECALQLYQGDTALHVAAAAYDTDLARRLVDLGADLRARNRRGGEPLHAATRGGPGSTGWDPARQRETIGYLVGAGADPNAAAAGGVTPLHRAVRNRCSGAVEALLQLGADPRLANDSGSTAADLTRWTTGRGGSGSMEARAEQQRIVGLLGVSD